MLRLLFSLSFFVLGLSVLFPILLDSPELNQRFPQAMTTLREYVQQCQQSETVQSIQFYVSQTIRNFNTFLLTKVSPELNRFSDVCMEWIPSQWIDRVAQTSQHLSAMYTSLPVFQTYPFLILPAIGLSFALPLVTAFSLLGYFLVTVPSQNELTFNAPLRHFRLVLTSLLAGAFLTIHAFCPERFFMALNSQPLLIAHAILFFMSAGFSLSRPIVLSELFLSATTAGMLGLCLKQSLVVDLWLAFTVLTGLHGVNALVSAWQLSACWTQGSPVKPRRTRRR